MLRDVVYARSLKIKYQHYVTAPPFEYDISQLSAEWELTRGLFECNQGNNTEPGFLPVYVPLPHVVPHHHHHHFRFGVHRAKHFPSCLCVCVTARPATCHSAVKNWCAPIITFSPLSLITPSRPPILVEVAMRRWRHGDNFRNLEVPYPFSPWPISAYCCAHVAQHSQLTTKRTRPRRRCQPRTEAAKTTTEIVSVSPSLKLKEVFRHISMPLFSCRTVLSLSFFLQDCFLRRCVCVCLCVLCWVLCYAFPEGMFLFSEVADNVHL